MRSQKARRSCGARTHGCVWDVAEVRDVCRVQRLEAFSSVTKVIEPLNISGLNVEGKGGSQVAECAVNLRCGYDALEPEQSKTLCAGGRRVAERNEG